MGQFILSFFLTLCITARELDFEESTYRGTIQDNALLLETILLSEGFDENVRFTHSGGKCFFSHKMLNNLTEEKV